MQMLMKYEWPGNIRELQNVCERLQILSEGHMIMINDIPDNIRTPEETKSSLQYDPTITLHDKKYILKALEHFGGNRTSSG